MRLTLNGRDEHTGLVSIACTALGGQLEKQRVESLTTSILSVLLLESAQGQTLFG